MSSETRRLKRVTMLVGFMVDDLERGRPHPHIIGCLDADTIECIPYEDEDRLWRELREKMLGPAQDDYEFRQVDVLLDEGQLQELVKTREIAGVVASDKEDSRG